MNKFLKKELGIIIENKKTEGKDILKIFFKILISLVLGIWKTRRPQQAPYILVQYSGRLSGNEWRRHSPEFFLQKHYIHLQEIL